MPDMPTERVASNRVGLNRHFGRRWVVGLAAAAFSLAAAEAVWAGPRAELSPIPIGNAAIKKGKQDVTYRLPADIDGPLDQAILFIGAKPKKAPPDKRTIKEILNPVDPGRHSAEITFTVNGKPLPKWTLGDTATGYVIHPKTLREGNADFDKSIIKMTIEAATDADMVVCPVASLPEIGLLVPEEKCGTVVELSQAAKDPESKQYLETLAKELAQDYKGARDGYQALSKSKNETIARFARRGLRLMKYWMRPYKISGNFNEHYRWGLFAQQCGFYGIGRIEFEECRILTPGNVTAQIHSAEMGEHTGLPLLDVNDYLVRAARGAADVLQQMRQAGEDTSLLDPVDWHVLVVILRSRSYTETVNGVPETKIHTLKPGEITAIKNLWLIAGRMVLGVTGGRLRLVTSFYEVADETERPYVKYGDTEGPAPDILDERGWFDGVVSIRPRVPSDGDRKNTTVSCEIGPKGAALTDCFDDTDINGYTLALYEQFAEAVARSEAGPGLPLGQDVVGCGHQPNVNIGQACRAALHYYLTPAMLRRAKTNDLARPGTYVRFWSVDGPYPITEPAPQGTPARKHVLDPIPTDGAKTPVRIESATDFVDLSRVYPGTGWARARARCWVYSPSGQTVRMFLGQNDGLAVRVNGRVAHEGRFFAGNSMGDQPLCDTLASAADLAPGWNEIEVVVESLPPPNDKGWGFSLRFCDWKNNPVPGLAYAATRPENDVVPPAAGPEVGKYYDWAATYGDFHESLPRLDAAALRRITGIADLTLSGSIGRRDGYFAIGSAAHPAGPGWTPAPSSWSATSRDETLNNVLDWRRESCAGLRYQKDGKAHDLLFLRPEAVEAYLWLLIEPAAAADVYGDSPLGQRVLGYSLIPAGGGTFRPLIVIDTLLGDESGWPIDEEDLLEPWPFAVPAKAGR